MVYSTGQPCTIDFQLYPELSNRERFLLLHPSTYGRELFDHISQHCLIPHGNFNLYLTCDTTIDLADAKEKTMSELGVDFSFDVDSNEGPKYVLYVTNSTVTLNSLAWWFTCYETRYQQKKPKQEQDECVSNCTFSWAPEDGSLFPERQGKEPETFNYPDQPGRLVQPYTDEPEASNRPFPEHIEDESEQCFKLDFIGYAPPNDRRYGDFEDRRTRRQLVCSKANTSYQNLDDSIPWVGDLENSEHKNSSEKPEGYVGLVNQAMTCYLNSLLQALYMTPEFRNALYNWEYGEGSENDEANSIPYQLQKLFLNLQTSSRTAVETTALTKSFGWDSTEAWQQHDIQELCRVMFDALEMKFANTQQADLINRLYEGKMTDYVKCLECGTEKTREDTFLDIPLPVRPFGSNIAHNSVEEALRAFVQYETLEGANQYHCDKCNKKCDAHKGLKFTKFPYLLTLHLKRFDFDYKTFHRIKLNDKVTFPDILNLNSFISTGLNQESTESKEDLNFGGKCDDSSTTDSGTINEDCAPFENSLSNSSHSINHDHEDDEGIDIYNGPSTSSCSPQAQETENNRINYDSTDGPYQYELFSILIHSGTAIGGHYYAYIKDFRTQEWLCFNDQNVTEITQEDIQKTYGGGPPRAYYSSACRSSTNAYLLMYRQIDPARNALPMQVEEFPKHIQELLTNIKENEDNDIKNNQHRKIIRAYRIQICYRRPDTDEWEGHSIIKGPYTTLAGLTEYAYKKLFLNKVVSLDQCRLVSYDPIADLTIESYEGKEDEIIANIWSRQNLPSCLLMETRGKDETFERYYPGGVITKVYIMDIHKGEIADGPINVRALISMTLVEYKQMLGTKLNMDPKQMQIVSYCKSSKWPDCDDVTLEGLGPLTPVKMFVAACVSDEEILAFFALTPKFENVISLNVQLPDVSKEILENLHTITLAEKPMEMERPVLPKEPEKVVANNVQATPCPVNDSSRDSNKNCDARKQDVVKRMKEHLNIADAPEEESNTPEQSNSEDSSLSDSDKTLVRDPPEEDDGYLLETQMSFHKRDMETLCLEMKDIINKSDVDEDSENYFKAMPYTINNQKWLKVLVDNRIDYSNFKRDLEHYVGVPAEYFNIYQVCDDDVPESSLHRLTYCVDGQKVNIKLKQVLRPDEFEVKLYLLKLNARHPYKFLCEWFLSKEKTVRQTKKEILETLEKNFGIIIPLERCRLRIRRHDKPARVMLDDQKVEQYQYCMSYDKMIAIQELLEPDPVTDPNQAVIFVKMYYPIVIHEFDEYAEIVLNEKTLQEVKRKISAISRIPEENLEIAKGRLFDVSPTKAYDWSGYGFEGYFGNGAVIVYRDTRSPVTVFADEDCAPRERDQAPVQEMFEVSKYRSRVPREKPRRSQKTLRINYRTC